MLIWILEKYSNLQHCYKMRGQLTIQRILAFVMLLIFMFSITPKKYLHDLVADHTDFYGVSLKGKVTLSQSGFNCHTEDLVVSTPFIESTSCPNFSIDPLYKESPYTDLLFQYSQSFITKDSRGPPSIA